MKRLPPPIALRVTLAIVVTLTLTPVLTAGGEPRALESTTPQLAQGTPDDLALDEQPLESARATGRPTRPPAGDPLR